MADKKVHYIESFSKGQITLPKVLRDLLGLGNDFWLKVYEDKGKSRTQHSSRRCGYCVNRNRI